MTENEVIWNEEAQHVAERVQQTNAAISQEWQDLIARERQTAFERCWASYGYREGVGS